MTEDVLLTRDRGALVITLNRPKALNALSLEMIRAITPALRAAAVDPEVDFILIEGTGERAFCAGGDVRAVAMATRDPDSRLPSDFFAEEYTLNHLIHTFPKPFVALVRGICMGGGVGLSVHGSHRVVAEQNLTFAMPETGIGLFPDVGATWMLTRCPGATGMYLALTGARLGSEDAFYVGYATHIVKDEDFDAVKAALLERSPADKAGVDAVLAEFQKRVLSVAMLAPHRPAIDRCFGLGSIEAILAALRIENTPWAEEQRAILATKSPTSLKVTFEQIWGGRDLSIEEVFQREYRMTQRFMQGGEFYEGIRALLIDKDGKPNWNPASLDEVSGDDVADYFLPLPENELILG
ncbi:enoyl-CoA hydratase/isomerase family protein [Lacibacterium aquatile]|uniref:3-hydroxyisobutyryl-CoA hydrolase n=1 Tax=Lacibacterium aquatile TaxID=1168082 RepID=A0ABW5DMP2_9PROT